MEIGHIFSMGHIVVIHPMSLKHNSHVGIDAISDFLAPRPWDVPLPILYFDFPKVHECRVPNQLQLVVGC